MTAPVYLGSPTLIIEPPKPPELKGMAAVEWVDYRGRVWDLMGTDSRVFLGDGIRGLNMPPITRYGTKSTLAGTRRAGWRVEEREVFWPLVIRHDARNQSWVNQDAAFWETLFPGREGQWVLTQPNGVKRRLRLVYDEDNDPTYHVDPARHGWFAYGVRLVADEEPYWLGTDRSGEWAVGDPRDFFGTGGPPFWISPSHTFGSATLTNPGDVEAWPIWTLIGPFTSGTVGIGSKVLTIPFGLPEGRSLVINSNPWGPTALMDDGTDRTGDISDLGFAPIPAGDSIPLTVQLIGSGSVKVRITPRHYRAW